MGILKDLVTENLLIRGFRETDGEDLYDIYLMKMAIQFGKILMNMHYLKMNAIVRKI